MTELLPWTLNELLHPEKVRFINRYRQIRKKYLTTATPSKKREVLEYLQAEYWEDLLITVLTKR